MDAAARASANVAVAAAAAANAGRALRVVGLMSGTSVDGIDVAVCVVRARAAAAAGDGDGAGEDAAMGFDVKMEHGACIPWDAAVRDRILALLQSGRAASVSAAAATSTTSALLAELCEMNFAMAEAFADAVLRVLRDAGVPVAAVDLVACHGQTIWHNVQPGGAGDVTSTLQMACGAVIAARTGITCTCDFRTADVALGGQGAPLASTFDWMCLRPAPCATPHAPGARSCAWRSLQNVGGIGNLTFVPCRCRGVGTSAGVEGSSDAVAAPLAFDTGPGNVLMDEAMRYTTDDRACCDTNGALASTGRVWPGLLAIMQQHPYFAIAPPRTTGRELFSRALLVEWMQSPEARGIGAADLLCTLTELTAWSIVDSCVRYAPGPVSEIAVSGGGVHNAFLMQRIDALGRERLPSLARVTTTAALGVDDDMKEAMIFALLGAMCVLGVPGNVRSCTRARATAVLGCVYPGANYGALMRSIWAR